MRWNAACLVLGSLVLPLLTGCSLFQKKEASMTADMYDPAYEAKAGADPYADGSAGTYNDPYATAYGTPASANPAYDAAAVPGSQTGQYHTVAKRETLYSLARAYYGDARRWKDIYEANRAEVSDPNKIFVGQRLIIP